MSGLFFIGDDGLDNLPASLRPQIQDVLHQSREISPKAMARAFSNEGLEDTVAAKCWLDHEEEKVRFWRGEGLSHEFLEHLASDLLEPSLKRAARLPCIGEYIDSPCLAFASGSHLYGIAEEQSDWDALVLAGSFCAVKTDDSEPFFRVYTPGFLFQDAKRGLRHAWELLVAPPSCQMAWNPGMEKIRALALQTLSRDRIPWRNGSRLYFQSWYPRFFIKPADEADPSIRRWKMKRGWPYKLGYYMFLDAYLADLAEKAGKYQTTIIDKEIAFVLCKMKQGEMTLQEWLELMAKLLPPGCSLKDGRGKFPVEFNATAQITR